ncbi:globin-like [Toxorhynchites rutilus septentrionalis]|uniref:globin-like n=1 Tax=Toxorhynchites rutilus septentrionalis TaxID=329112 RepID=UPI00247AF1FE|nr:globin-like [Toxorhynchites rutilus septentrionalis]
MSEDSDFTTPDETGLTKPQKVVLSEAWSIIKEDMVTHGTNIFVRFFEEHPNYLSYYDFSHDSEATELMENKSLHAHALNVMHLLGALIDYGFDNPVMYKSSLAKSVKNHRRYHVTKADVKIVCGVITTYCMQALEDHSSEMLVSAFAAFMDSIIAAYD